MSNLRPIPCWFLANSIALAQQPLAVKIFDLMDVTRSIQGHSEPGLPFLAYTLRVAPGETLTATLEHESKGEIFIAAYGPLDWKATLNGTRLRRRVITQSASWTNSGKEPVQVAFLVDDPAKRSTSGVPFTLRFERKAN